MGASQPASKRRQMLEQFVQKNPNDAFARYGLAMECVNEKDFPAAETHFTELVATHPEYVAAYYQFGRMLAAQNRIAEARRILNEGMARAARANDAHARDEMQAALDELS
jgi:thioredoxin-like negative regulator of GroEL